ncbi:MAG: polyprenyl synthetase family protein [Caldilineae bacterium]|nr:polyprenyl synthetase family protein [Caldilineae bacterium]
MSAGATSPDIGDWAAGAIGIGLGPVHERMREALVGRGAARDQLGLYRHLRYHLGWSDRAGRPVEERGGKGIRPLLCLTACAAVGGDPERATGMAAAIELTHEFSLIHDDLEDRDRQRRGRDTLWTVVGEAQAINAGDALFSIARQQIADPRSELAAEQLLRAYQRYDAACLELAEGQFLDIDFETAEAVAIEAYLKMVEGKTGALLGAAAALGALAGGAGEAEADAFDRFGRALGVGFQMQDDVLGIWGDPERTGKPAGNDLARRKRSLPVLLAAELPELAAPLEALYGSGGAPAPDAVAVLSAAMDAAGIRAQASRVAEAQANAALDALSSLSLVDAPRRALEALVIGAVRRDR